MSITKAYFGKAQDGRPVDIYTLVNENDVKVSITNFGGTVVSLCVPDRNGKLEDIVLGHDKLQDYFDCPYFGAIIGRHSNRIEGGEYEINGVKYQVAKNDGNNHLHGGVKGFDKVVWDAEVINTGGAEALELSYLSKDGEENYPGNIKVKVTYTLKNDNSLAIDYLAVTDKDTVVNLTNHSYFNLSGHASGNIKSHKLMINADYFTVINNECIPTGEIRDVYDTPMDFTSLTSIGIGLESKDEQMVCGNGYDHNWILKISGEKPEKVAELFEENSGRTMEVYTTKPGLQFYSGNFLNGTMVGKDGAIYNKWAGLCLETQYFPNGLKYKHFPSPILKAGAEYRHTTIYKFLTK